MLARLGVISFKLSLPILRLVLNNTQRSRVIVKAEDCILLVKPWLGSGAWMLPGGGIGRSENPAKAAVRELREETAISVPVRSLKKLGTIPFNAYGLRYDNVCFYTELPKKPETVFSEIFLEIAAFTWAPISNIPAHCSPDVSEALALAGLLHTAKS